MTVTTILQAIWLLLPMLLGPDADWTNSSWGMWLGTFVPIYAVAIPLGLLILMKLPAQEPPTLKLDTKNFLLFVPMCISVMYAGNLIGNMLSLALSGGKAVNAVMNYAMDSNPLKLLVMVILAPALEEYLCRKQIIDRTRQYGEKTAVLLSALVFALLHQNLYQFFYAFGLGLIFAYIYIRTGLLRYPILLHGFVNFLGSVVAPWLMTMIDLTALENLDSAASLEEIVQIVGPMLPGFLMYMTYAMLLLGFSIWGLILLIQRCEKLIWKEAAAPLPKGTAFKTVYLNWGMALYILICAATCFLALL